MLQSGLVPADTLAWKEGMANWTRLQELITASSQPGISFPAPPPQKKSILGIISLAISLVLIPGWIAILVVAGMAHNNGTATPGFNMVIGLLFFAGVFVNFLGIVLGAIAAFSAKAKTVPIVGLSLNGFTIAVLIGLIILGLVAQHRL